MTMPLLGMSTLFSWGTPAALGLSDLTWALYAPNDRLSSQLCLETELGK